MPYKIKKSGSGYKVTSPGRSYSKHPISKDKAKRQLAAIHMHTNEAVIPDEEVENDPGLAYVQQLAKERFGSMPKLYRHATGTIFVDVNGKVYKVVSGGLNTVQFKPAHLQRTNEGTMDYDDDPEWEQWESEAYDYASEVSPNLWTGDMFPSFARQAYKSGMDPKAFVDSFIKSHDDVSADIRYPVDPGIGTGSHMEYLKDPEAFIRRSKKMKGVKESSVEVDDGPKMESVFKIGEDLQDLSSTKPPPGSQPLKAGELGKLGQVGQSAQKGLDALQGAGQDVDAFKTPDGHFMAYPKAGGPASTPLQADLTKGGLWSPVTGSQSGSFHPMTSPS